MKKITLLSLLAVVACQSPTNDAEHNATAFALDNLDINAAACEDFFQYTSGGWREANPIPETEVRWGEFNKLAEANKQKIKVLFEEVTKGSYEKGSDEQLIGDLVTSGMDSTSRNERGTAELSSYLEEVDQVVSLEELFALMARNKFAGISSPISVYVSTDAKNSNAHALYVGQSGIGLPDRDYYLKSDEESAQLQQKYRDHISAMGDLVESPIDAQKIYELEYALASAMKSRVEMRDADARYNLMTQVDWQNLAPSLPIEAFMAELSLFASGPELATEEVINSSPEFYSRLELLLATFDLAVWKDYHKWHIIKGASSALNDALEIQDFEFYQKTLNGKPKMNPRWKRVQGSTGMLGQQVGHLYVKRFFSEESKAEVEQMVENLREAFRGRIDQLTWMTPETKVKARKKLDAFTYKIGYPDTWKDISDLEISKDSYFANMKEMQHYFTKENLQKLDQPVDKSEWGMGAHIVNAYYNPLNNEVVFPAGILQPPFYNPDADAAINYGAIGGVIGHEFSHGFDDQGSKYGPDGNLENWWTDQDKSQFDSLTERLASQYDAYEVLPDVHVNGHLTLGENIADLGGLTLAYYAYQNYKSTKEVAPVDGFTDDQRVFLGWAQVWQSNAREEYLKNQVTTDPHSPAQFRVSGPVSNMPEFREAFGCESGNNLKEEGTEIIIW